jgi:transglutaminase-like putative cysteine protease
MILRIYGVLMLILFQQNVVAQANLSVQSIPENLKENANAVVRLDQTEIFIESRKSMKVKTKRIVTVLNEQGLGSMNAGEYYGGSEKVKSIEAVIYNASGSEIKKLKKKDFKDFSVSEGSVVSDGRVLSLNYTPVQYPFTMVYTSETETSNTAFVPGWTPVSDFYTGVEKSKVKIIYNKDLGFRHKEYNNSEIAVAKEETENSVVYAAENIPAYRQEDYAPALSTVVPKVLFGLTKFHLEGVDGEARDWAEFGAWMFKNLLEGTDELPDETIQNIRKLTSNENDPVKKAKLVYEYVQGKTRYISIQLGIGGWKPMKAKDVDRLGYGDCKALSNYTRALLKAVGVESYYTVIYGNRYKRNITDDFTSMQGNHIILAIPHNNKITWLECTSQIAPFGFQGDFTDDRLALIVKPDKGEIVRTHVYETSGNTKVCKGKYTLTDAGAIKGTIIFTSKGTQYDDKYMFETFPADEVVKRYKARFNTINNIKFSKTGLKNNKETQEFTEDLALEAEGYANKSGNRLIFAVNAFNQIYNVPQRYRTRRLPFSIERGWYDADDIVIELPEGYALEAKPDNITIKEKYGEYKAEYILESPNRLLYRRSMQLNNGYYANSEYESYRAFMEKVARNDNAKVVLVKS